MFQDTKLPLTAWFAAIYHLAQSKNGISSIELGAKARGQAGHSLADQAQADAGDGGARGREAQARRPGRGRRRLPRRRAPGRQARPRCRGQDADRCRGRDHARAQAEAAAAERGQGLPQEGGGEARQAGLRARQQRRQRRPVLLAGGREGRLPALPDGDRLRQAGRELGAVPVGQHDAWATSRPRSPAPTTTSAPKHAQAYLTSFAYRFNRRFQLDSIVERLAWAAVHTAPQPYRVVICGCVRRLIRMVIEFIGLPGAGKTTLCQQVAEILSKHDIAVRQTSYGSARRSSKMGRTLSKSCHFLGAFILNHKHTILSAADIARTKQKSPIDYLKVTFNWIIASFFVQRNHCALEITLMDQGVFQALWSIGFSAQDEAWASTMSGRVSLMSIPDIVVVVEASPRTIEGRLRAHRSHISRLEAELQTGSALWARSISLLETVKMIMSLQQVAVMVIDTETPEPLNATATSVAEGIMLRCRLNGC